jgi:hypothetical protein
VEFTLGTLGSGVILFAVVVICSDGTIYEHTHGMTRKARDINFWSTHKVEEAAWLTIYQNMGYQRILILTVIPTRNSD